MHIGAVLTGLSEFSVKHEVCPGYVWEVTDVAKGEKGELDMTIFLYSSVKFKNK